MKGVRLHGLDGVRIQHIAKIVGMATGAIYTYFDSKEDLMRACFEQVDRQIAAIFDRETPDAQRIADDPEGEIRRMWTPYYRWLVSHPDETVFYHRYRDDPDFPEYDRQRDVSYFKSFSQLVMAFELRFHLTQRVGREILWLHVINCTIMFAKNVTEGVLPDNEETENSVFRLIMFGLKGLLRSEPRE